MAAEPEAPRALRDPERLALLHATGLLDAARLESFDRLARAAARAVRAPVAQVNLLSADRQVPKASFGPEPWASGGPVTLDFSFCQHVVASGEPIVLHDARAHPLTRDSPAALEAGIVAYAAVPLTTGGGHTLGTLCVVDFEVRAWTADELEILQDLAGVAVAEIEGRLRSGEQAQAALRESEARYRTLTEVDPDGIVVMDDAGLIVSANPAMERIFGYRAEELVGEPLSMLVPERLREAHRAGVQRYLATGRRHIPWTGVELPGLTRGGREIATEISFGEYVHGGRHVFAGFIHDISQRKREEARRATEHAITRVLADARSIEEASARILQAMGGTLGWDLGALWRVDPDAEVLRCIEIWHPPDLPAGRFEAATRGTAFPPGVGLPGRVWASGEVVWIHEVADDPDFPRGPAAAEAGLHTAFGFPITVGGRVRGVIEFFTRELEEADESLLRTLAAVGSEIGQFVERMQAEAARDQALAEALAARRGAEEQATELEAQAEELQHQAVRLEETRAELEVANEDLRRANDELRLRTEEAERARAGAEEANRAKSQFLANMSHELRTPINAVVGYTDLLEMGIAGPLNEGQRSHLERIRASSQHLLTLVNEILDLAKVESGQLQVARDRVALAETVESVLGLILPQAARAGVEVRNEVGRAGEVAYCGDRDRVRQVLLNLLSNAVKFTGRGGRVRIACEVADRPDPGTETRGEGPWLRVDVEDTGIGITAEHTGEIFEPFFQVDGGYTRESGGTGLGLSISRRLARLMDGDITLRSRPGEGSRFTLWLPADSRPTPEAEHRRPWPAAPREIPRLSELARLLVRCTDGIVREWGDRLREDPALPGAGELDRAQLEDHAPTFLVDLGLALLALDEGGGEPALMRDGTDIQRVIAERHGAQRARLGWTEAALHREYQILREVVERTLRENLPAPADATLDEAIAILRRLLEQAERISVRGRRQAEHGGS
jgi:PAS domain S-box-containing protein